MHIRILGCSGGIGAGSRTSAMLIDDDVLLDAGTGIGDLALDDLHSIRHVFLTHAHLDHIAGLPMLIDSIFTEEVDTPVTVYGRTETLKAIQDHLFNWVIWPDFADLPTQKTRCCVTSSAIRATRIRSGTGFSCRRRRAHGSGIGYTVQNSGGVLRSAATPKPTRRCGRC